MTEDIEGSCHSRGSHASSLLLPDNRCPWNSDKPLQVATSLALQSYGLMFQGNCGPPLMPIHPQPARPRKPTRPLTHGTGSLKNHRLHSLFLNSRSLHHHFHPPSPHIITKHTPTFPSWVRLPSQYRPLATARPRSLSWQDCCCRRRACVQSAFLLKEVPSVRRALPPAGRRQVYKQLMR